MSRYYDRNGQPLTRDEWAAATEGNKRVAEDTVGGHWVSTVWLGLDHSWGEGPPLIFETMVFPASDGDVTSWSEEYVARYSTEAEALAGHASVVEQLRAGTLPIYAEASA